jgi:Nucleoside 2-deoxyribosyltransferase like
MSSAVVVTAPEPLALAPGMRSVFLAGSIEQGAAVDWQRALSTALADCPVTIFNPRRAKWDASWPQSAADPRFREQVQWELDALDRADVIAMYLDPATRAPVSLLELGLFARTKRMVVCCPDGYWRKGNVEIVCERYGVDTVQTLDELARCVRARLCP